MGLIALSMALFACGDNKNEEKTDSVATPVEEVAAPELQMGEYQGILPLADSGTPEMAVLVIKEGNLCDYKRPGEELKDVPYTFAEGKLTFADKAFELADGKLYMLDTEGKRANIEGSETYIFNMIPAEATPVEEVPEAEEAPAK